MALAAEQNFDAHIDGQLMCSLQQQTFIGKIGQCFECPSTSSLVGSRCMPHLLGVRWCPLFSSRHSYYGSKSCLFYFKTVYLVTCRLCAFDSPSRQQARMTAHAGHARYSSRCDHSRHLEHYISSFECIASPFQLVVGSTTALQPCMKGNLRAVILLYT